MKDNFIKKNWLKISIILFICFIIIPVIMNVFKLQEGFIDPLLDSNKRPISASSIDTQLNNNLRDIYGINKDINKSVIDIYGINKDINKSVIDIYSMNNDINNNMYKTSTSITDMRKINNKLNNIYNINTDLSDNVYRKSDSTKDLYDISGNNLLNIILASLYGLSNKIDNIEKKDETPNEKIKCIADFGTNIGDDLCCGQSGVLTNTKYVCPENYSKCDNMKCGSKYGTCVKP
jgi:hypothetical protein